jgi:hypothetical protein
MAIVCMAQWKYIDTSKWSLKLRQAAKASQPPVVGQENPSSSMLKLAEFQRHGAKHKTGDEGEWPTIISLAGVYDEDLPGQNGSRLIG